MDEGLRLAGLIQPLKYGIGSIHIGGVVFVMMQAELCFGDKRFKGIIGIWQLWQYVKFFVDHFRITS